MAAPRAAKAPAVFQPIVRFPLETEADRVAEKLAWALYREIISTMQTERNAQQKIGLSEIGTDCMKCLVRFLSLEYVKPRDPEREWKPMVGTFVHAGLEEHMRAKYVDPVTTDTADMLDLVERIKGFAKALGAVDVVIHLEETVALREFPGFTSPHGDWAGFVLDGHCDLMVEIFMPDGTVLCVVVDWKCLGPKSLAEKTAGKLGATYEHQLPAYGLGWVLRGYNVTHVMLAAVPRDGDLPQSAFVIDRYDPQPVITRIAMMENLIDTARLVGWDRVLQAQPASSFCFDCRRFEAAESKSLMDAYR